MRHKAWVFLTLKQAAWGPLLVFGAFVVATKGFGVYVYYPNLDVPTHLLGGVAIAYFFQCAIHNAQTEVGDIPRSVQALLALTATATTAVLWEFLEYFSDRLLGTYMMRGMTDVLSDLFFGILGGALWTVLYRPDARMARSMT